MTSNRPKDVAADMSGQFPTCVSHIEALFLHCFLLRSDSEVTAQALVADSLIYFSAVFRCHYKLWPEELSHVYISYNQNISF